jgi:hypothetical protein
MSPASRNIRRLTSVLALTASLAAPAGADEHSRSVNGHTVYLGVVPAEIVKGHDPGHPEREMHGGAPTRSGQYHVMIAIFETATGKRVTDAQLVARVSEPGLAPVQKKLEPMEISGAMSFGNYFAMGGAGPYRIKLAIELPAAKRKLDTEFRNIRTR